VARLFPNEQQAADQAQAPRRQLTPDEAARAARAELKQLEEQVAQGKGDRIRYLTLLSNVASYEWGESQQLKGEERERKLADSKDHFKRADKEIQDLRRKGDASDPSWERSYADMLRLYGKVSMSLWHSYEDADQRTYTKDATKRAQAIQDRKDADAAFTTAVDLAKKHSMPPRQLGDLLRDKGLNAALLADDQYRPQGAELAPVDAPKWHALKTSAMKDLKEAAELLKSAATQDMEKGRLAEARGPFNLAFRAYKDYLNEADKDFAQRRKDGRPIDPAAQKSYEKAEKDVIELARAYGRNVMLLWHSYDNAAVPSYVFDNKGAQLPEVVQDRKAIHEAFATAVKLAEKHPLAPINFIDLLRDQGLNASRLADDQFRPLRLGQDPDPKNIQDWRKLKDEAIAVFEKADARLDKKDLLGTKDPRQALDLDKPAEKPKPEIFKKALEFRPKILYELALVETHRAHEKKDSSKFAATSQVADSAGKHYVQAMNAWDQYEKPDERPGNLVFRSGLAYDNLVQLYKDYMTFTNLMMATHPKADVVAFMAGQFGDAQTKLFNIRRVDTNIPIRP
jgi:hypothetical protein